MAWQRPHIMPWCYPRADLFISGPTRRVLPVSPPSVRSSQNCPEFCCKIRHFHWPGQKQGTSSPGQSFSQLPNKHFQRDSRGPPVRTWPGPSPPPRTLPSPREGPTCLPLPVRRPGRPANSCPASAPTRVPSPPPHWGSTLRGRDAKKCPPTG